MIRHPLSFLGGCLAGALAMYYFDERSGAYRRSLLRDRFTSGQRDLSHLSQAKGRRALDQARGVMATGRLDRQTRREPESDWQLHERVRARLGHFVNHPKLVHTEVDNGLVTLSGHILRKERQQALSGLRGVTGVRELRDQLQVHETEAELQRVAGLEGSARQSLRQTA